MDKNKQAIDQIIRIMDDFRAKVGKARSAYRAKIAAILKKIDERNLESAREKLRNSNL